MLPAHLAPLEALEQRPRLLRVEPWPRILHAHDEVVGFPAHGYLHAALLGVADGVVNHVQHRVAQLLLISGHDRHAAWGTGSAQPYPLRFRDHTELVYDALHDVAEIDLSNVEHDLSHLDPGNAQQVVHEVDEPLAGSGESL